MKEQEEGASWPGGVFVRGRPGSYLENDFTGV
jgi:hypothetical protein